MLETRVIGGNRLVNFVEKNKGVVSFILCMGVLSGIANYEHGIDVCLTAGTKQVVYSSLSAFFLLNFIYTPLEKRFGDWDIKELIPAMVPALITIFLNLGVHSLKGTEEIFLSSLPTILSAGLGLPLYHGVNRIEQLGEEIANSVNEVLSSDTVYFLTV